MRRTAVMTHLLLLAMLAAGCTRLGYFKRAERPATLTTGPSVGAPAPDIEGEDFDGRRLKLSDYRGKVVVVAFWAST
ncbi:MAG: redoxin domain-containing protein [Planctomycetes bacterium]|nr:redoxin domain-containing protein [Planctomycetota bacterium]